jgi:hypothetical protein
MMIIRSVVVSMELSRVTAGNLSAPYAFNLVQYERFLSIDRNSVSGAFTAFSMQTCADQRLGAAQGDAWVAAGKSRGCCWQSASKNRER